jgi:exosortase
VNWQPAIIRTPARVIPATFRCARTQLHSWNPRALILSCLVLVLYAPILEALAKQWWNDQDFGHGLFIPFVSSYVLWRDRKVWREKPIRPNNWGLLAMIGAVALLILGSLGAELFVSRVSLLVLLGGMTVFLAGWAVLRAVSFPLGYLFLMVPIPVIIYNQISFPLQLLASRIATICLESASIPVLRNGNVLSFSNYSLEIVEACSGIRSLMTLISFTIAYAYLFEHRRWTRYLLTCLTLPIALASNALRIVGIGVMAHWFGPVAAEGFLHGFSSWAIFVTSLIAVCALHWLLRQIVNGREAAAHE